MFDNVSVRLATEADQGLDAFDYTKLTAINMCPRWGLIRYDQHKRMPGEGRAMPLEMGAAAHDGFAAVRFFQLLEFGPKVYGSKFSQQAVIEHGYKLFSKERFDPVVALFTSNEDWRQRCIGGAHAIVNSSGFYDDPSDKRRTLSNLESSLIGYVDRLDLEKTIPLFVPERNIIGIEVPFDMVIEFDINQPIKDLVKRFRYIGRIDGIELEVQKNSIGIAENKTATRLDNSWFDSFVLSHQVTGYAIAISELIFPDGSAIIEDANVYGMMIPLPKTYDLGGIATNPVRRDRERFLEWFRWFFHTTETWERYKDDPLNAPEYTHSCNRYFRSCSFLPLCAVHGEDRQQVFEEMTLDKWSPLDDGD